ncbi:unnamed protein product [Somion occarium]|uniref:Uncharacterized protein n=1 Tax=Somion occarium TaxID=3059160 RepID=A0ABP1DCL9_9APHY
MPEKRRTSFTRGPSSLRHPFGPFEPSSLVTEDVIELLQDSGQEHKEVESASPKSQEAASEKPQYRSRFDAPPSLGRLLLVRRAETAGNIPDGLNTKIARSALQSKYKSISKSPLSLNRLLRQASKGVPLGSSLTTNGVGKKVRTDEVLDTITDILSEEDDLMTKVFLFDETVDVDPSPHLPTAEEHLQHLRKRKGRRSQSLPSKLSRQVLRLDGLGVSGMMDLLDQGPLKHKQCEPPLRRSKSTSDIALPSRKQKGLKKLIPTSRTVKPPASKSLIPKSRKSKYRHSARSLIHGNSGLLDRFLTCQDLLVREVQANAAYLLMTEQLEVTDVLYRIREKRQLLEKSLGNGRSLWFRGSQARKRAQVDLNSKSFDVKGKGREEVQHSVRLNEIFPSGLTSSDFFLKILESDMMDLASLRTPRPSGPSNSKSYPRSKRPAQVVTAVTVNDPPIASTVVRVD